jgi:hypothetical protein
MIGNHSPTSTMQPIEPAKVTKLITQTDSMTAPDSTADVEQNQISGTPPQSTTWPGSVQPQSDPLLAIILGVVGGLIALLIFAIVLLLVIVACRGIRKQRTLQSEGRYIHK